MQCTDELPVGPTGEAVVPRVPRLKQRVLSIARDRQTPTAQMPAEQLT